VSYWVSVGDAHLNMTSNMRRMFIYYGVHMPALNGQPAAEVAVRLRTALAAIDRTSVDKLDTFNARNGWGDWRAATRFLWAIHDACRADPTDTVRVSW
jgi:hypothetical protein